MQSVAMILRNLVALNFLARAVRALFNNLHPGFLLRKKRKKRKRKEKKKERRREEELARKEEKIQKPKTPTRGKSKIQKN